MSRYRMTFEFDAADDDSAKVVMCEASRAITTGGMRVKHGIDLLREGVRPWQSVAVLVRESAPDRAPARVKS